MFLVSSYNDDKYKIRSNTYFIFDAALWKLMKFTNIRKYYDTSLSIKMIKCRILLC